MDKKFIAHFRKDGCVQTVKEHCVNVSKYAAGSLRSLGLEKTGELLGLLHDMGKEKNDFQKYIMSLDGVRGSVRHAYVGARYLLDLNDKEFAVVILSYVIAAHHSLFDCLDNGTDNGFSRIRERDDGYAEAVGNYFGDVLKNEDFDKLLKASVLEVSGKLKQILALKQKNVQVAKNDLRFYVSLLVRLLLSGLKDADNKDTFEFCEDMMFPFVDAKWDLYISNMNCLFERFTLDTPINQARNRLSEQCKVLENKPTGIYRLNLPTGAGKTLASLRAAVLHAKKQNKKHIFYAVPLLTITKQNTKVVYDAVGQVDVLEHDSDITYEKGSDEQLYTENWSSPITVTTLVQFLNTLFGHKSSNIRRFLSLADSVVIIDEVQSVPMNMLSLFNLAVNFLSLFCNTTIILCSATQPCLEKVNHPLVGAEDLVPYDKGLWDTFKRADFKSVKMDLDAVGQFIGENLESNFLCVCNTKKEARDVYGQLVGMGIPTYHLSAGMCGKHREDVLEKVKKALENQEKFVCVSTQVIEAGVDISFQKVMRFAAGLDNVLQAAGRCNRDGAYGKGIVYIAFINHEDLWGLSMITKQQDALRSLLLWSDDILQEEAVRKYYEVLYKSFSVKDAMDYPIKLDGVSTSFVELMGDNDVFKAMHRNYPYPLRQSFRTAAEHFTVFDAETYTVLVPYGKGKDWIAELYSQKSLQNIYHMLKVLRNLKPYTVNLYKNRFKRLCSCGAITEKEVGDSVVYVLDDSYYGEFGVSDDMLGGQNVI